jgi:hypothetical protein
VCPNSRYRCGQKSETNQSFIAHGIAGKLLFLLGQFMDFVSAVASGLCLGVVRLRLRGNFHDRLSELAARLVLSFQRLKRDPIAVVRSGTTQAAPDTGIWKMPAGRKARRFGMAGTQSNLQPGRWFPRNLFQAGDRERSASIARDVLNMSVSGANL